MLLEIVPMPGGNSAFVSLLLVLNASEGESEGNLFVPADLIKPGLEVDTAEVPRCSTLPGREAGSRLKFKIGLLSC